MASERILLVEDDTDIRELVTHSLKRAGFRVSATGLGSEAMGILSDDRHDLAILDVMLPDMPGTEICRRIRENERLRVMPVIFLTARVEEHDRIYGFSVGADDYILKPFSPRELVARVQAILRRTTGSISGDAVEVNELSIDMDRRQVRIGETLVHLTFKEFEVLKTLVIAKGRVVERMQLLEDVWGMDSTSGPRSVDVTITRLRDKLSRFSTCVRTVTGVGYQWNPDGHKEDAN
ncbi:MAG: response regulator in two-component regulatory system with PhoR (or CreC), regulation of Pi uptake [Fibrobacterota bacterium]|jgi:two-component system phosphate regulon response regulator PhoB